MAEELNYVAVKFNTNQPPTEGVIYDDVRSQRATWSSEKRAQAENIYDDVSSKETTTTPAHPTPILKANGPQKWRRSVSTPTPTAAILAALCLLLASAVLAMALHAKGAADELDELRRRWRPLGIERQRLNRTLEAVLALDVFHVMAYCPQRVLSLCTACPRHWLLFGSKCYLFLHHQYSGTWKSWEESAGICDQPEPLLQRREARLLDGSHQGHHYGQVGVARRKRAQSDLLAKRSDLQKLPLRLVVQVGDGLVPGQLEPSLLLHEEPIRLPNARLPGI
ncbi:uncharacterized protein LOC144198857 isoform X2 [Stigmatopora nigra]